MMEKVLYWLVKWPWFVAIVVVLGLAQLPLGPWYVSAWFMIGVALLVVNFARAAKFRLAQAMIVPTHRAQPIRPVGHAEAKVHL
jgi:uncharacterized protein (DUF58 family)